MAASKGFHRHMRGEYVFVADRTVVLKAFLPADVHREGSRHARVAVHTVEVIDPESFPNPAQIAVGAVINLPAQKLFMFTDNNLLTMSITAPFKHLSSSKILQIGQ
ncbi:hypothetical protein MLD38_027965 [Melastoma candidum]|uniref:Uncharacterized protein n=1 Tax=Melastoma candidum TaxID=119954 RepID=A0ACB9N0G9_9MYRT|nr:hypothetical protein MLD38_027965 [Melastoma candidum]